MSALIHKNMDSNSLYALFLFLCIHTLCISGDKDELMTALDKFNTGLDVLEKAPMDNKSKQKIIDIIRMKLDDHWMKLMNDVNGTAAKNGQPSAEAINSNNEGSFADFKPVLFSFEPGKDDSKEELKESVNEGDSYVASGEPEIEDCEEEEDVLPERPNKFKRISASFGDISDFPSEAIDQANKQINIVGDFRDGFINLGKKKLCQKKKEEKENIGFRNLRTTNQKTYLLVKTP